MTFAVRQFAFADSIKILPIPIEKRQTVTEVKL